eukprot:gene30287-39508_t
MQMIRDSQATTRADAERTVQLCEQSRQQLVLLSRDTTEIDKKIDIHTLENTYNVPTFMVLLPATKKAFICGFTFELVRCGPKGMGYKVKNLKSWVKKALPVLKVGLMLLQVGLLASGMPIPLTGLANSIVSSLDSHADKISAAIRRLQVADDQERVRSAYETLAAFLKEADHTLENIGMSQQITSSAGKVVWIKNDPKNH